MYLFWTFLLFCGGGKCIDDIESTHMNGRKENGNYLGRNEFSLFGANRFRCERIQSNLNKFQNYRSDFKKIVHTIIAIRLEFFFRFLFT